MTNNSRAFIMAFVFVAMTAAVGLYDVWILPAGATIASQFDLAGRAHAAMPKEQALAIVPIVSLGVVGLLTLLARFGSGRDRLARSEGVFAWVVLWVAVLLFSVEIFIGVKISNPRLDLLRLVFAVVGLVLIMVGNVLGKLRQNQLLGVRTRWTLGDERVWDKTHRFTGWAMVLGGVVLLLIDLAGPSGPWLIAATVACAASPLLLGVLYSARQWRREHHA